MAKRVEIDGKYYRKRRGELVLIPDQWVGKTLYEQTKRKRHSISKRTRKLKNRST